jgi:hypothetical protein
VTATVRIAEGGGPVSETQDGPDWWKAVDGRWYPPERHPDVVPPAPLPSLSTEGAAPRSGEIAPVPTVNGPGYAPRNTAVPAAAASINGLAVASLVMGLVGFILFGLGGLLAIIFGHIARGQIRRSPDRQAGSGLALAGLILGYLQVIGGVLVAIVAVIALGSVADDSQSAACDIELRLMQTAAEAYRVDAGAYPTSQAEVVGTYLSDASTNYDFAPDGSGGVVALPGSRCE